MKDRVIPLKTGGYEPLFDYLKGIAIIMVVLAHGTGCLKDFLLYPLWIDQAVPLFIMIQVFHAYKKDTVSYPSLSKIWHRIFYPFLLVQLIYFLYIVGKCLYHNIDPILQIKPFLFKGGGGPGSYYIWIYAQIAILCPLFKKVINYKSGLFFMVLICLLVEIICSLTNIPDSLYRLLCLRYIFLLYLGYLWVQQGILLTKKTTALAVMSSILILALYFIHKWNPVCNFEPWIYNTNWTIFHWFTYYLPWSLLAFAICKCYQLNPGNRINKFVLLCGKRSYEIFLFQMLVFGISPMVSWLNTIISFIPLLFYERVAVSNLTKLKK